MANTRSSTAAEAANMALNAQQIQQLIDALQNRNRLGMTSCKASFDGSKELYKVEAFINEVKIFKTTEHISDADALQGLPLLFKKDAAIWWEGIRTTIINWDGAITSLRNAYAPPLKNYQLYTKIIESKQIENETTEKYICRQRALITRLQQNHDEITQIDLVYGGLLRYIRKDMPRNSFITFLELLTRARVIEEHQGEFKTKIKFCDYCKMKNHSTMECNRKPRFGESKNETVKFESKKAEEDNTVVVTVKCYGCGKPGYIRSNCPNCQQTVQAASIDLEISHLTITFDIPIPTVPCKINGLSESAYLDTAAKTSIAGDSLYQQLKENGYQFETRHARIKQADGKIKNEIVKIIHAVIELHGRFFNIMFVVLSDTDNNQTLLGIDFLTQARIIISPWQQSWWFSDNQNDLIPYEGYKNYNSTQNEQPITNENVPTTISKSKKKRLKQMFKLQKFAKNYDIQPLKENQENLIQQKQLSPSEPKKSVTANTEFKFKIPKIIPHKDKQLKLAENNQQEQLYETVLQQIQSGYMNPIYLKPISPIKNAPPRKTKLSSKIKDTFQGLFGTPSPPDSPILTLPRTPGRDLEDMTYIDININPEDMSYLDIKMIEIEEEIVKLTVEQEMKLNTLLQNYDEIFKETGPPCPYVVHKINTGDHLPIASPPYRTSLQKRELMKIELDSMLKQDVIEESESPWAFPVVMTPKPDGSIRFCVDYRKLNAITVKDSYPLPRIDDLLQEAQSTMFMSTIDLKSGYWQIQMNREDVEKTAFVTPFGSYQFTKMPFGLCNAPATFQRLMNVFRNGLPSVLLLIYLDDLIIISNSFERHMEDLQKVFERLKHFKLRAKQSKCKFACSKLKYLGHILTPNGIMLDPSKVAAIVERQPPRNVNEVLSFIQTCSWYRKFIQDFAKISQPITQLTRKNVTWKWTQNEQESFDKLKMALTSAPVLGQLDDSQPLTIKTDASGYALGAVLVQGNIEHEHPIEYASRLLTKAEMNYSTIEREALAVVWALEKFRGYVEDKEINLITDHQPLKWLMNIKSPSGRLARWALRIQAFNLNIQYTPGRTNVVADTLSRPPINDKNMVEENDSNQELSFNTIQVDLPKYSADQLRSEQLMDEELKTIIEDFESQKKDERFIKWTNRGYFMNKGVLYKYAEISDESFEDAQLVVPRQNITSILQSYHDAPTAGHYGINRTINRIAQRYYWSTMRKDITSYVGKCIECQQYKATNLKPAGILQTTASNQRFETLAIDLIGPLPKSRFGHKYIFIIEDVATGWVELFPIKNAQADICAHILIYEIFFRYGISRRLISDNGTQFVSAVFQKLTYCLNIKQSFIPVYHPQSNPAERKNRDIRAQLSILVANDHTNWPDKLQTIRFAMNSVKNESTGFSAAYLTFGRELRTVDDIEHDLRSIATLENFVPTITPKLLQISETLKDVKETKLIVHNRNAKYLDGKRREDPGYQPGSAVWITSHKKSSAPDNITKKFLPRKEGPYIILQKIGSATYEVGLLNDPETIIGKYHTSSITPFTGSLLELEDQPLDEHHQSDN